MATIDEAFGSQSPMNADLKAGIDAISELQDIVFTRYVRLVLPLDGYVYWVRADLVSSSAAFNGARMGTTMLNAGQRTTAAAATITARGSLHYTSEKKQDQDGTFAVNKVIFTSTVPVEDLDQIGPQELYIGAFDELVFAFSSHSNLYRPQAGIWHYVGDAVYPDMMTQIVDDIAAFDARSVVVSNSLPLWLFFNGYEPTLPAYGFGNPVLTLYPSFLVPSNLPPPYASVHIEPSSQRALQGTPLLGPTMSHSQLVTEKVSITLFGTRNYNAMDFIDCVLQRSFDYAEFGIMNSPILRDEKRTQDELFVIGMKKSLEFEINYYQARVRNMARQYIQRVIPSYDFRSQVAA